LASFVALTSAFATAPPDASVTVPLIWPEGACAAALWTCEMPKNAIANQTEMKNLPKDITCLSLMIHTSTQV
jgi:hypothetical protein